MQTTTSALFGLRSARMQRLAAILLVRKMPGSLRRLWPLARLSPQTIAGISKTWEACGCFHFESSLCRPVPPCRVSYIRSHAKIENMVSRFLAAFFAVCLAAMGQTLSVEQLLSMVRSSEKFIAEGKMTDRELANYLLKVKLTERLDDRIIEELQGQ